jgi:hypothetical protein
VCDTPALVDKSQQLWGDLRLTDDDEDATATAAAAAAVGNTSSPTADAAINSGASAFARHHHVCDVVCVRSAIQAALASLKEDADGVLDLTSISAAGKPGVQLAPGVARLIATSSKLSFVRQLLASFAAHGTQCAAVVARLSRRRDRPQSTADVAVQSIDARARRRAARARARRTSMRCVAHGQRRSLR